MVLNKPLTRNDFELIMEGVTLEDGADVRIANMLLKSSSVTIESICDALSAFRDTRKRLLTSSHSWMKEALRDISRSSSSLWRELLRALRDVIPAIEKQVAVAD